MLATAGIPPAPKPDAIVLVLDATELGRQLYLALQVRELGLPTVVALTMVDVLERSGDRCEIEQLTEALGMSVVPVRGSKGLEALGQAVERSLEVSQLKGPRGEACEDPADVADPVNTLSVEVPNSWSRGQEQRAREIARLTLIQVDDTAAPGPRTTNDSADPTASERRAFHDRARTIRAEARSNGVDLDQALIAARYRWIDERLERFVSHGKTDHLKRSDRIDSVLLHPVFGLAIFALLMTLAFQALFAGADPMIGWIESAVAWVADGTQSLLEPSLFREFLVSGVIEGVGAVVVFLPQIIMIFLFLGFLEDTGYMARVVYLVDRVMRLVGLNGRAFVPMLSGFACAVPAILATRTMERRRDRLLTILVVPLMTCSARLPVYGLMIAAMYPPGEGSSLAQGALMTGMYLFSIAAAMFVAGLIGRTILKQKPSPLVQQVPPYRRPELMSVLRSMQRRVGIFLKEAGTVILACTVLMWGLLSFPRDSEGERAAETQLEQLEQRAEELEPEDLETQVAELEKAAASARLRNSYAARFGKTLEPTIQPLGYDWQIGVGLLGAFAAREVFVSTMAVVYGLDGESDEQSRPLRTAIREQRREDGSKLYTARTCLSLMIFFALACQCLSTVAAARRETGGFRWPIFMMIYMTALAYGSSFVVYQGMGLLGFE